MFARAVSSKLGSWGHGPAAAWLARYWRHGGRYQLCFLFFLFVSCFFHVLGTVACSPGLK